MSYLIKAQEKGIIHLDEKAQTVLYVHQGLRRSLENPEESVQIQAFLRLIFEYRYPPACIKVCQTVKMGSARKEADIVAYADETCQHPILVVECKKEGVSESIFREAIEQGFSYAIAIGASYVWVTSLDREAYFEVWKHAVGERKKNQLHDIPAFASEKSRWFLLKRWLYRIHAIPKKVSQHPLTADVAALIAPFSLLFLFLAFITVAYHRHLAVFLQQLNRISPFYTTWSSIYDLIIGLALFGSLSTINLIIPSWKILPSRKRKKYHLIALTCFFGLPCWFVGKIYSPSWWNETHYQKLFFKTWMFLEPFFVALPLVILQAYAVGWFNVRLQRQRTAIKKWRKKKSLIA